MMVKNMSFIFMICKLFDIFVTLFHINEFTNSYKKSYIFDRIVKKFKQLMRRFYGKYQIRLYSILRVLPTSNINYILYRTSGHGIHEVFNSILS